jgi:hypothetical protein
MGIKTDLGLLSTVFQAKARQLLAALKTDPVWTAQDIGPL